MPPDFNRGYEQDSKSGFIPCLHRRFTMNETHDSGTAQQEGSATLGKAQAEQGVRYTLARGTVVPYIRLDGTPFAKGLPGCNDQLTELVRRANAAQVLAEALGGVLAGISMQGRCVTGRFAPGSLARARAALAQWEAA
jgi:hypothetical protein